MLRREVENPAWLDRVGVGRIQEVLDEPSEEEPAIGVFQVHYTLRGDPHTQRLLSLIVSAGDIQSLEEALAHLRRLTDEPH